MSQTREYGNSLYWRLPATTTAGIPRWSYRVTDGRSTYANCKAAASAGRSLHSSLLHFIVRSRSCPRLLRWIAEAIIRHAII